MSKNKAHQELLVIIHDVCSGIKEHVHDKTLSLDDNLKEYEEWYNEKHKAFKVLRYQPVELRMISGPKKDKWYEKILSWLKGDKSKWYYVNVVYDKVDEETFVNSHIYGCWADAMEHKEQLKHKENFKYVGTLAFRSDYPYYEWTLGPNGNWE